ncbi:hypothetical protein Skr01_48200 [Sphaerisporangium krabiense]|uniref:PASTA domain-containing protein n=1 Tax=Sphaerisporangium krabiense TaxID=763782 RepID=A0A7W8Z1X4_9ACTN|nr:hypothetical protein [Sphaerisporangium krabiense]MBB5625932.1 hypothetical protein [Sphaerisporangium krabiense]GII64735.1 hypothetical protein Skr01_48200 [Sphaerisporangium krabiense]
MKDIDDIDVITRKLARVEPGRPGGHAAGPGARELLTAITAERPEPSAPRPRRHSARRLTVGLVGAGLLAGGIVVGPSLLLKDGGTSSYAVTKDSDGVVYVQVRNFRDKAGLAKRLEELNVPAIVDYAPPGMWCEEPRGAYAEDVPRGLYSVPENIPGEEGGEGWQMRIDTKLFKPGQTFVWTISDRSTSTILMSGPVAPCVLVPDASREVRVIEPDYRPATTKGGSLSGFRVDEKTVGEVRPELERRGLKVTYLIMAVAPDNPGGFGEVRTQSRPVGDDWIVWEAEQSIRRPGLIRLLVTEKRFDRNPVYGGPRDDVIKE